MGIFGKTLFFTAQRLRRSTALSLLEANRSTPWLRAEEVERLQWASLMKLLRHAQLNVPYYTELFRNIGANADDIKSLSDFKQIPPLTKEILVERKDDLIARNIERSRLIPHSSGGSTGIPVTFFHDRALLDQSDAAVYRYLENAGWTPGDWVAFFLGFTKRVYGLPRWNFELRQHLRRMYQFDAHQASPAMMEGWIRTFRRIRPTVIHGFPSTIARFAQYVRDEACKMPSVKGVCTTAETLLPAQRALIEDVFGGKVFDCYGSSEVRNIASECAMGSMHINSDYVVVEEEHSALESAGPLLVTSLKAFAMPFIRYRNLDVGALSEEKCNCGSGFPIMRLTVGRVNDYFPLPGGNVVHGLTLTHQFYGAEGVASFQYHQTSIDTIDLYVVPRPGNEASRNEAIKRAVERLQSLSNAPLAISIKLVDAIPLSLAGKHRFTRSDVRV